MQIKSLILMIIFNYSFVCCIEPITTGTMITVAKILGIVGGVGTAGYVGNKLTKQNAKNNIPNIIQDLNQNPHAPNELHKKKLLKRKGRALATTTSELIDNYLNLHETPVPTTYRNTAGLVATQNLNREKRRDLIELLRSSRQKTLATLWVYRELKEIKGEEITQHIENQ